MPSSYTTSLRLTLPATGELTGTWGTTVNTGITELLDSAVAGTTTISTWGGAGVPYTLSNTDGAADEARKMFIVATGAPGEAKNVICPAVSKLYFFRNDTTGGFALTLKTSGGSGIAVPAGQYKVLYCNGTNVVEAFNSLASLTLGTALAASSGGTGQSTYTTGDLIYASGASALSKLGIGTNGQILTSTGTAPQWSTLSGVAVTTFSAGTTGFTPSTATSGAVTLGGTLATTNGGTGLTSFTSGGVVYASSSSALTTGSALTFDGTKLETAGSSAGTTLEVLRLSNNGAGVNTQAQVLFASTSTPYASIAGGYGASAPQMTFNLPSATAGNYVWQITSAEQMRLTSTGLGIGTSSPGAKLHVKVGTDQNLLTTSVSSKVTNLAVNDAGSTYVDWQQYANQFLWFTTSTERMRLDSSGNLGIGTSSPSAYGGKLNVYAGDVVVADAGTSSGASAPRIGSASQALVFKTNSGGGSASEVARFDGSGNLGIGTSSPGYKLTVQGSANNENIVNIRNAAGTVDGDTTNLIRFTANGNVLWANARYDAFAHIWHGNAFERMRLDSSGNLGLGVTPTTRLDIAMPAGAGTPRARIDQVSDNPYYELQRWTGTGSNFAGIRIRNIQGAIAFDQSSLDAIGSQSFTQAMTLDTSGNLQIGRTTSSGSPYKLELNSTADTRLALSVGTTLTGGIDAAANLMTLVAYGVSTPMTFQVNGSERMRLDSSGNLGIGGTPLSGGNSSRWVTVGSDVASNYGGGFISAQNGTAKGYVYYDNVSSANTFVFQGAPGVSVGFRANASGSNQMTLDSSGNLGLGVTPSAWLNYKALQIAGGNALVGFQSSITGIHQNDYFDGTDRYYATGTAAAKYLLNAGTHAWYTAPSGTADNAISFTQAMTLDASGNLGVGTTNSTPANGEGICVGASSTITRIDMRNSTTGDATGDGTSLYLNGNDFTVENRENGFVAFSTNNTERARITSGGNLLVGTTASETARRVRIYGSEATSAATTLQLLTSTSGTGVNDGFTLELDGSEAYVWNYENANIRFGTNNTERARITSGGDLLVGDTSQPTSASNRLAVVGTRGIDVKSVGGATDVTATFWNNATTGDNIFLSLRTETTDTQRGSIDYDRAGGLTRYNTTSDYRAKDIIGPVQNPGATIDALKVYEGVMKGATQSRPMLIAHEAQAHAPYAVSGVKDEVNEDGTPKFQQIDVSSLVPLLLAEIQSLRARVAALESQP